MLEKFDSVLDWVLRGGLWLSAVMIFGIVLINTANLLRRWFIGTPFGWVLEISLILFVYAVMLCIPALYSSKELIQMRLIEEIVSKRIGVYLDFLVEIAILLFLLYLIPKSVSLSASQITTLSRGLGIPRIYVTLPVPLSGVLLILANINTLIHHFLDLFSISRGSKDN